MRPRRHADLIGTRVRHGRRCSHMQVAREHLVSHARNIRRNWLRLAQIILGPHEIAKLNAEYGAAAIARSSSVSLMPPSAVSAK